ncbi:MAG: hypothetical protein MJZ34_06925 [Paludibacteraceae bacterium]|nr:hypothetical protein [Paludibacteraceae bacterium]
MTNDEVIYVKNIHNGNYKKYIGKTVFVNENVTLDNMNFKRLPDIKYLYVGGYFNCSNNHLTSLKGCPKEVGGNFFCSYNKLTSLEYAPKYVGGRFDCNGNKLTTLSGGPNTVIGDFICVRNMLTSLEGSPSCVGGDFICSKNMLKNFEGSPKYIGGDCQFSYGQDFSLDGFCCEYFGGKLITSLYSIAPDGKVSHISDEKFVMDMEIINERYRRMRMFKNPTIDEYLKNEE